MKMKKKEKTIQLRTENLKRYLSVAEATGRHIQFPSNEDGIPKWGVSKLKGKKRIKNLLVTGTGRCGTHFISKALNQTGVIDFPHEKTGEHGTSSTWFSVDSDWYPVALHHIEDLTAHIGERRSDYKFNNVIHVVRDPLKCIHSINSVFRKITYDFHIENKVIPLTHNPFEKKGKYWKAMVLYYFVNKHIEKEFPNAIRIRIEDIEDEWSKVAEMAGAKGAELPIIKPTNTGRAIMPFFNKQEPITLEKLYKVNVKLCEDIMGMGKRYGYNY